MMLLGLAGVAVPLVLHLLARARYRSVDWGAMMFLTGSQAHRRQSSRLKQWLLLGLRMAILAMLALALARPVVSGSLRHLAPGGHVDTVVILDTSGSTAVEENSSLRFDLIRRAAISIISQLQRGDRVSLVAAGSWQTPEKLAGDLEQVAQTAATLSPSDGIADLASALNQAALLLEEGKSLNREIYIVCDRQAINWAQIDPHFAAGWRKRWSGTSPAPRIVVIPVGGEERGNLSVESFTAQNLPAIARQPVELEIRLKNNTRDALADVPLRITEGNKELFSSTLTLAAQARTTVRTTVTFDSPGCHVLKAQTKSAVMPADASRELSVLIVPPLPVLVISGDEREGFFRKESDFLRLALMPWSASGEQGSDPANVTVVTSARWLTPDAGKWPVVVLANIASLSDAQAREVEQYVYSGGGLILTVGNLVQSGEYNRQLFREGSGILPAKLGDSMTTSATTTMGLLGIDISHPIFRFLRGRPDPVPNITIGRHMPIDWMCSDTRQLMTLTTGEALLLERPVGRGKVLLFTSTIDSDWNTLPVSGLYLPMMQSMVRYLSASRLPQLNVRQGEPIVLNVEDLAEEKRPTIRRPDGKSEEMELQTSAITSELRYANTQRTGRYTLKLKVGQGDRRFTFVVQRPPEEGDLTSFTPAQMEQWRHILGFDVLDAQGEQLASAVGQGRQGRELWQPLLLAAIALCCMELWFSRRCGGKM